MHDRSMGFFGELKRRSVFHVGIAYVMASWTLLQIVDFSLEVIAAPDWILQVFVLAAVVAFPVFLVFAWVFEMTPEGIKKESDIDRSQSITPHTGRKPEILYLQPGDYEQAKQFGIRAAATVGYDPKPSIAVADALQNPKFLPRAIEMVSTWEGLKDGVLWRSLHLMLLGERELAFAHLEKTYEAGDPCAVHMNRLAGYDVVRDVPRFQAMRTKMNLWP